ncbi:MAG: hypothetical protein OEY23_00270 [Acidimicrobiia bacterium]|nr:hypothetical protein [Acidimicrobiia bacterium]
MGADRSPDAAGPGSSEAGGPGDGAAATADRFRRDDRAELPLYLGAVVVLIVGGALVRTWLLNWIAGPLFVVVFVGFGGAVLERARAGRAAPPATKSDASP